MSTFCMSVQTIHFWVGRGCKNQKILFTFNFFAIFFIIFMGIFGTQKMLMCTLFLWGGGVQKVYGLYIHENVDIYGRPLIRLLMLVPVDFVGR